MWKYLIEKEFKQFFRDPMLPRIVIVFPIVMMLVFPFAANMEVRNINLAVVDNDRTDMSSELVEKCTESGYFRLKKICSDPREAQRMMDRNTVDAILTIGEGFGRSMVTGDGFPVGIKVNTVNGTKGSIGSQYLSNCIMLFMQSHSDASAVSADSASGAVIEAAPKYYYNPYMDYKVFMVPALIVIAVTMVTGFFPALNIVGEKEAGTIEQMNVSPVNKTAFIVCKMIPYWAVAFFILTACLVIAWLVFGYVCRGSLLWIYFFTALHILVMAGLGLPQQLPAGDVRHLVLRRGVHADERDIHPDSLHARLGAGHHLHQSYEVLRRRDACGLPQGQRTARRLVRRGRSGRARSRHGQLGDSQLPKVGITKILR